MVLPFSEDLAQNLNDLLDRVAKNKASMILIDGGVGEGKTTLAVEIADYLNKKQIKLEVKDHPQLALGGEEFLKNLKKCYTDKLPVLIYDEAGDFHRRGALTRLNNVLNRTFETFRTFHIIVILVLPSFHVLDSDLFYKNIPRLLLHLSGRTEQQGNLEGYSLYRMFYIRDKMTKLIVKSMAYDQVRPNFHGHFRDLEPSRSKALDRISTKGKLATLDKSSIKLEGLINIKDIMGSLGCGYVTAHNRLKAAKIKHVRVIGRTFYYPNNAVEILLRHDPDE